MHLVDVLEEALQLAQSSGFEVRQEWLNEKGGGACRIGERCVLFVDLSLTAQEQLEQVVAALAGRGDLKFPPSSSSELRRLFGPDSPS
jgi:hypothetical protein